MIGTTARPRNGEDDIRPSLLSRMAPPQQSAATTTTTTTRPQKLEKYSLAWILANQHKKDERNGEWIPISSLKWTKKRKAQPGWLRDLEFKLDVASALKNFVSSASKPKQQLTDKEKEKAMKLLLACKPHDSAIPLAGGVRMGCRSENRPWLEPTHCLGHCPVQRGDEFVRERGGLPLARCMKDYRSRGNSSAETNTTQEPILKKKNVARACFVYLWDYVVSNSPTHPIPIHHSRAALHLCGHLLQKSCDCRAHLIQTTTQHKPGGSLLWQWVQCVARHPTDDNSSDLQQRQALQHETYLLLAYLAQHYEAWYPQFSVALQFLQQNCPYLITAQTNKSEEVILGNMVDWRRQRDLALKHANQQEERVLHWIRRFYQCMDVLVPRMTTDTSNHHSHDASNDTASQQQQATTSEETYTADTNDARVNNAENDDISLNDDDENIDWEDGWDDDDDSSGAAKIQSTSDDNDEVHSTAPASQPSEQKSTSTLQHAEMVARTMAAMKNTAGLLRGGGLEIDFSKSSSDATPLHPRSLPRHPLRQEEHAKFKKVVQVLEKHMHRLTRWVEGLTHADNLVLVKLSAESNAALVSLPLDQSKQRRVVRSRMMELKTQVARVLSLAARLQEPTTAHQHDEPSSKEADNPPIATTTTSSNNEEGEPPTDTQAGAVSAVATRPLLLSSSRSPPERHASLSTALDRRRRRHQGLLTSRRANHHRIQIKYRKT